VAQWIPDPDGMDEVIERMAADVAAMYARAEMAMVRAIVLDLKMSKDIPEGSIETSVRLSRLRQASQQIVAYLREAMPETVQRVLETAVEGGAHAALSQLSQLAGVIDITQRGVWLTGNVAANLLAADLTSRLEEMHLRILRYPDDVYRQAVAQYASETLFGKSSKRTQQRIWQDLLNKGITGFTDSAGRNWNLATYTEMATRTATHRAWSDGHLESMAGNGQDLVSVIVGRGACRKCSEYAGKVLCYRGEPGRRSVEHATVDDTYVTVNVYSTVDQAREHGFLHPNCKCRLVAYLPGLSVPADQTSFSERENTARATLRNLEVQVRKSKMEALTALSPGEQLAARRKTAALQSQIRAHVEDFNLQRKRYREQLNLGHRNV
jgi:hypothetical protein